MPVLPCTSNRDQLSHTHTYYKYHHNALRYLHSSTGISVITQMIINLSGGPLDRVSIQNSHWSRPSSDFAEARLVRDNHPGE